MDDDWRPRGPLNMAFGRVDVSLREGVFPAAAVYPRKILKYWHELCDFEPFLARFPVNNCYLLGVILLYKHRKYIACIHVTIFNSTHRVTCPRSAYRAISPDVARKIAVGTAYINYFCSITSITA